MGILNIIKTEKKTRLRQKNKTEQNKKTVTHSEYLQKSPTKRKEEWSGAIRKSLVSVTSVTPRLGTNRERRFMGHIKHGGRQLENNNTGLVEFISKEKTSPGENSSSGPARAKLDIVK